MTASACSADEVAEYLMRNPDFFDAHVELLTSIRVPHPHGSRTISLHERQLELVRGKLRTCETQFAELVRTGRDNDELAGKLDDWVRRLLRVTDAHALPDAVRAGLVEVFAVPQAALRLWRPDGSDAALDGAQSAIGDAVAFARSIKQPFCGPNRDFEVVRWLAGAGEETASVALLPLRVPEYADAFGLIVLGSPDPERFRSGMGTVFLERVARLAAASLSRLITV